MERSCKTMVMQVQAQGKGPVCRWDEIHDIIASRSKDSSLVIINLPDPPELSLEHNSESLDYMNYMEGLAEGLPRALYVHGSGQEIINLDNID